MKASELLKRYAGGERDFRGAKLGNAKLRQANLIGVNFSGVDLSGADLSDTNLSGVNLSAANLFITDLSGANLSGANLSGVKLESANLDLINLNCANLSHANLIRAKLTRANLSAINMRFAKLNYANLRYSNLAGAKLNEADLCNADLSDANLAGANLTDAKLFGANLDGTILSETRSHSSSKEDWITLLQGLQTDFIKRLQSGNCNLLHCAKESQHSELTIISGDRLDQLSDFCWEMADKYKRNSPVRKVFINNMKGKLGEEVVKMRLGSFVTEIDYEKRLSGDGKVDFRLTSDPNIGIQVKTRSSSFDKVQWEISQEEVDKNAVLICLLSQESFNERQTEYNLIMAGFLPTNLILLKNGRTSIGITQLLYSGGLRSYLESLVNLKSDSPILPIKSVLTQKYRAQPMTRYNHSSLPLLSYDENGDIIF